MASGTLYHYRLSANNGGGGAVTGDATFTTLTPTQGVADATASAGLSGNNALPTAVPFNDGVNNLLKYAFNMNLAGPDVSVLTPGSGGAGLPSVTTTGSGAGGVLCVEFVRRVGSGLV